MKQKLALFKTEKYVAVVLDEVKIKQGLIYDRNHSTISGLTYLGSANNALIRLSKLDTGPSCC